MGDLLVISPNGQGRHEAALSQLELSPADITDLSIELPAGMDNLFGLETYEGLFTQAKQAVGWYRTQMSWTVYLILENKLWRHRLIPVCQFCWTNQEKVEVDPDQPVCPTHGPLEKKRIVKVQKYEYEDDYLETLGQMVDRGNASLKKYKQSLRIAAHLGYDTIGKVMEAGGIDTFSDVYDAAIADRRTGEVLEMRRLQLPDGVNPSEYIREVIEEKKGYLTEMSDNMKEWRKSLQAALGLSKTRIWFVIDWPKREIVWHKEVIDPHGSPRHWSGNLWDSSTPDDVKETFCRYIRVSLEDNPITA